MAVDSLEELGEFSLDLREERALLKGEFETLIWRENTGLKQTSFSLNLVRGRPNKNLIEYLENDDGVILMENKKIEEVNIYFFINPCAFYFPIRGWVRLARNFEEREGAVGKPPLP